MDREWFIIWAHENLEIFLVEIFWSNFFLTYKCPVPYLLKIFFFFCKTFTSLSHFKKREKSNKEGKVGGEQQKEAQSSQSRPAGRVIESAARAAKRLEGNPIQALKESNEFLQQELIEFKEQTARMCTTQKWNYV